MPDQAAGLIALLCGIKLRRHVARFPPELGGVCWRLDDGTYVAIINGDTHRFRQRFSLFHELYHALAHHYPWLTNSETAANRFAAGCLMPRRLLLPRRTWPLPRLTGCFQVSRPAMLRRLLEVAYRPVLKPHPEVEKFVHNLTEAGMMWADGF